MRVREATDVQVMIVRAINQIQTPASRQIGRWITKMMSGIHPARSQVKIIRFTTNVFNLYHNILVQSDHINAFLFKHRGEVTDSQ